MEGRGLRTVLDWMDRGLVETCPAGDVAGHPFSQCEYYSVRLFISNRVESRWEFFMWPLRLA
jgi:hypothetical protein